MKKESKGAQPKPTTASHVSPERIAIALALAEAMGTHHDAESYRLTIRTNPSSLWAMKLQNMRVVPSKAYYV